MSTYIYGLNPARFSWPMQPPCQKWDSPLYCASNQAVSTCICGYTEPQRRTVLLPKTHKEPLICSLTTAVTLTSTAQHPYLDCLPWDLVTPFWQPGLYLQALLKHSSVHVSVAAHPSAALDNDVIDSSSSCLLTWETSLQRHILIVLLPSNPSHLPLSDPAKPMLDMEKLTERTFIIPKKSRS